MKYLLYIGHPAHYHMLRNLAHELRGRGHEVCFAVKAKDVLLQLLQQEDTEQIRLAGTPRETGKLAMLTHLIQREWALWRLLRKRKFDLMLGTEPSISHLGRFFGIPSIQMVEDDVSVIPHLARITFPFADAILAPDSCDLGKWTYKKVAYPGYQKLAYLHPNRFSPDREKVKHLMGNGRKFFLLRFSALHAHHDGGIQGISDRLAHEIVKRLAPHGNVYISSERPIAGPLDSYRLNIPVKDIHHALYYADLLIGDSQSMAVEAALLGTLSLRFSDFAGRIGVLEELEHRFGMTYGVRADNPDGLLRKLDEILSTQNLTEEMHRKRDHLLKEKIDVTAFWVWLFENYPHSLQRLKAEPAYVLQFSGA